MTSFVHETENNFKHIGAIKLTIINKIYTNLIIVYAITKILNC